MTLAVMQNRIIDVAESCLYLNEMMRTAYFDCFNGAAGDMIVGGLLDAGASFQELEKELAKLALPDCRISAEKVKKQGISATQFRVHTGTGAKPHRHLKHITELIAAASLAPAIRDTAIRIFTRLAEAEAKIHGTTIEKVHFHEVGAIDAFIDIVGTCAALNLLGVERIVCSPIPVGGGNIQCEHGIMPVPAPATAELLRGMPIAATQEPGELCTPTGAAILTTLASEFQAMPSMTVSTVGYGAGTREGKTRPNVLRVVIGDAEGMPSGEFEQVMLLETNLDDATPQVLGYCMERLIEAGALDAWTQPIQMKKQRSAVLLSVLCRPADAAAMEQVLFRETPTLGIRRRPVERRTLPRRIELVNTKFGEIRVKVAMSDLWPTATPEYEDCREAARKHDVPLRAVQAEVMRAWQEKMR